MSGVPPPQPHYELEDGLFDHDPLTARRDYDPAGPRIPSHPPKFGRPLRRRRRSASVSRIPLDFPHQLAAEALRPDKPAPLYTAKDGIPTIRIRALQHMTICHLRRQLAAQVRRIVEADAATPAEMERVRKTMKHYAQALRDLRYMLESPSSDKRIATFLRDLLYMTAHADGAIFTDVGLIPRTDEEPYLHVSDYTGHGGYHHLQDSRVQQTREFLDRARMALFGGVALVAPMLIMRLHPTELTTLLTTSLCVLGVAVALAWFMKDAAKKDILAATAAYAAVLVVFVGTSG